MAAALTQITPFVPCSKLDRQLAFYCDILGFERGFEAEGYAFLRRDAVALRLDEVFDDVDLNDSERGGSFYIDVNGIDALYQEMKPALDSLPKGRVTPPFDLEYGQREFHVNDEDCTRVYFGEGIERHG